MPRGAVFEQVFPAFPSVGQSTGGIWPPKTANLAGRHVTTGPKSLWARILDQFCDLLPEVGTVENDLETHVRFPPCLRRIPRSIFGAGASRHDARWRSPLCMQNLLHVHGAALQTARVSWQQCVARFALSRSGPPTKNVSGQCCG